MYNLPATTSDFLTPNNLNAFWYILTRSRRFLKEIDFTFLKASPKFFFQFNRNMFLSMRLSQK